LTYGRRSAPRGTFICSAEGLPLDSPFPSVWLSGYDASDPAAGVHCNAVPTDWARSAARTLKRLGQIVV